MTSRPTKPATSCGDVGTSQVVTARNNPPVRRGRALELDISLSKKIILSYFQKKELCNCINRCSNTVPIFSIYFFNFENAFSAAAIVISIS
jgi:hypothetical protein